MPWPCLIAMALVLLAGCFRSQGRDEPADAGLNGWAYCDPSHPMAAYESCLAHPEVVRETERGPTASYLWRDSTRLAESSEQVQSCRCGIRCEAKCGAPSIGGIQPACGDPELGIVANQCILPCEVDSECPVGMRCVEEMGARWCAPVMPASDP